MRIGSDGPVLGLSEQTMVPAPVTHIKTKDVGRDKDKEKEKERERERERDRERAAAAAAKLQLSQQAGVQ